MWRKRKTLCKTKKLRNSVIKIVFSKTDEEFVPHPRWRGMSLPGQEEEAARDEGCSTALQKMERGAESVATSDTCSGSGEDSNET